MMIDLMDQEDLLQRLLKGSRLNPAEAEWLTAQGELNLLGMAADAKARALNPRRLAGYTVSRTIVYSNVCQPKCPFCAGTVAADDPRAFTLSAADVVAQVAEAVAQGVTTVTIQGGHRLDLPWEYYTGLLQAVKAAFPQVQIQAFSPTEIMVFNVGFQKTSRQVVAELKAAGLDVLFAGGVETMGTRTKEYRALLRGPWNEWVDVVHRCVDNHIPVVLPFVFGLGETVRERVGFLYRAREIQRRTLERGTPAFISLVPFTLNPVPEGAVQARPGYPDLVLPGQAGNTLPEADGALAEEGALRAEEEAMPVSGHEYLRMLALARLYVDNVPHLQVSPVTQGAKVAEIGLKTGADDFGGTYLEFAKAELAAARVGAIQPTEVERLIRDAGLHPVQRTATFDIINQPA